MSSEQEEKTLNDLREMAKLSLLSNRINSIQAKNLKMFPLIIFNGVKQAKVDYDFSHVALVDTAEDKKALLEKDDKKAALAIQYKLGKVDTKHFRVTYSLNIDESVINDNLDRRFQAIEGAVRTLFYSNVRVEVFFNDRKVFESKANG